MHSARGSANVLESARFCRVESFFIDMATNMSDDAWCFAHMQSSLQVEGEQELLSDSERMSLVNKLFTHTCQLTTVRSSLELDLGVFSSSCANELLQFMARGCRKVQKALIGEELLQFVGHVLQTTPWNAPSVGGQLLNLMKVLLNENRSAFLAVFGTEASSRFLFSIGVCLASWKRADVAAGSVCHEAVSFLVCCLPHLDLDGEDQIKRHIWPVVKRMLADGDVPESWLLKGSICDSINQKQINDRVLQQMKQEDLDTNVLSCPTAEYEPNLAQYSFLERIVFLFTSMYLNDIVKLADLDVDVAFGLQQILNIEVGLGAECKEILRGTLSSKRAERKIVRTEPVFDTQQSRLDKYRFSKCSFQECHHMESHEVPFKSCGGCNVERYCSEACQRKDWKSHKHVCHNTKPRSRQECRSA